MLEINNKLRYRQKLKGVSFSLPILKIDKNKLIGQRSQKSCKIKEDLNKIDKFYNDKAICKNIHTNINSASKLIYKNTAYSNGKLSTDKTKKESTEERQIESLKGRNSNNNKHHKTHSSYAAKLVNWPMLRSFKLMQFDQSLSNQLSVSDYNNANKNDLQLFNRIKYGREIKNKSIDYNHKDINIS